MNIPHIFYNQNQLYVIQGNRRSLINQLTCEQLDSAVARIREVKPYLLYFQQLISIDGYQFLNHLYTLDFLSCIDTEDPRQTYIDNCLMKPLSMLDMNEQLTRFFFLDIEYVLLIRERFSRNFRG